MVCQCVDSLHGWRVKALLVVLAALLLPQSASGASLTPEQARGILYVAYGQFHGPRTLIDDPPKIELVSKEKICQRMNAHSGCEYAAIYLNGESTILVDETIDFKSLWGTSVLVHEMVHHFQWKLRGMPQSCGEMMGRERQAYLIHAELLEKLGEFLSAYKVVKNGMMQMSHCPGDT